jgi:hypothetical protein
MIVEVIKVEDKKLDRIKNIHDRLREYTRQWARKKEVDLDRVAELRHEAIILNHQRYYDHVPVYRALAEEVGATSDPGIDYIASELVSTDDIFKSYNPEYLDNAKFDKMNKWLETIYIDEVDFPTEDLHNVAEWIARLAENGIISTFSSGTMGRLSFVPRDQYNWASFVTNGLSYLPYFLPGLDMSGPEFDVVSLSFERGNMGVGLVGQYAAAISKNSFFLYEGEISPDALRIMRRGAASEAEEELVRDYREMVLSRSDENYERVMGEIYKTVKERRHRMLVFGAPFQVMQLCEKIISSGRTLKLLPGSILVFGGGWKTFEGEKIDRDKLIDMIKESFGLEERMILEGFSMTEMNMTLMRCVDGRYHLPLLIEPVIYDDALMPMRGNNLTGLLGYLDPFATSYPGFLISGDLVTVIYGDCPCGLSGPAIVGEVTRAPGLEVKGCGGIMSEMRA